MKLSQKLSEKIRLQPRAFIQSGQATPGISLKFMPCCRAQKSGPTFERSADVREGK